MIPNTIAAGTLLLGALLFHLEGKHRHWKLRDWWAEAMVLGVLTVAAWWLATSIIKQCISITTHV